MKKALFSFFALVFVLSACESESDSLTGGNAGGSGARVPSKNKQDTTGVEDTTYSHSNDPAGAVESPLPPADPEPELLPEP